MGLKKLGFLLLISFARSTAINRPIPVQNFNGTILEILVENSPNHYWMHLDHENRIITVHWHQFFVSSSMLPPQYIIQGVMLSPMVYSIESTSNPVIQIEIIYQPQQYEFTFYTIPSSLMTPFRSMRTVSFWF